MSAFTINNLGNFNAGDLSARIAPRVDDAVTVSAIEGTSDSDLLIGTAFDETINGNDGDDVISGDAGDDLIDGGLGNYDRMFGDDGNDLITDLDGVLGAHGGAGNDTITVTFAPSWDDNTNLDNGSRSDGKITGGYGDDIITVTMDNSRFFINLKGDEPVSPISNNAQDGNDVITLQGVYAYSVVDLGGGNDTFNGGSGGDNVSGSGGNDTLLGGGGGDLLAGDDGDDLLNGGAGNDTLRGDAGNDQFVYNAFGDRRDTITDFGNGSDLIDLTALFGSLGYEATAPLADYLQLVQVGSDTQVQIDPDGLTGASEFNTLVTLSNVLVGDLAIGSNLLV